MNHSFSPFKNYLQLAKKWFKIHQDKQFLNLPQMNIVIGNESADLDSTIGSLIYSYYHFCTKQPNAVPLLQKQEKLEDTQILEVDWYIPVIQCSSEDFKSRFECVDLFEINQINTADLLFKEDIIFQNISKVKLLVSLYDHNCTTYPELKNNVIDILDHHKDLTSSFYDQNQQIVKNIQTIGSATSLLGEYFMKNTQLLDEVICDSIMKTIVLDTYNFDPKQQETRWNHRDSTAYSFLEEQLQTLNGGQVILSKNEIQERMEKLKFDVQKNLSLGLEKLLKKDYKQFNYIGLTKVGYSVFMIPPEQVLTFFKREQFEAEYTSFMKTNSLDILILLFAYPFEDIFERKIIALSDEKNQSKLIQIKEQLYSNLKIIEIDFSDNFEHFKANHFSFYDTTHTYTRKIIEPLVSNIQFI